MAGYGSAGVLPLRKAVGGGVEIMLTLERRSEPQHRPSAGGNRRNSIGAGVSPTRVRRGRGESGQGAQPSPRARGVYLHAMGGTAKEVDKGSAIATAAREFSEKVGSVLPGGCAASAAAVAAACTAEGSKVVWVARKTKYALFVYEVPEMHSDVAELFAEAETARTDGDKSIIQQQAMQSVKWLRVAPNGSVATGAAVGNDSSSSSNNNSTSGTTAMLQTILSEPLLRKHLAAISLEWGGPTASTTSSAAKHEVRFLCHPQTH